MALDAKSTPTITKVPKGGIPFAVNALETDATTAEELQAAPGAGLSLYITQVVLGSDDADAHPHIQDEDDNILFGPLLSSVEGPHLIRPGSTAIKMIANKALELKAAAAGNIFVYVEGIIAP